MKTGITPKKQLMNIERFNVEDASRSDCLCLDMNENVRGLPAQFIKNTASCITSEYISKYPEYKGLIANVAKLDGLKTMNICMANGSDAAIKYIFDAYIQKNDRVVLTDPTFAMYPVYCAIYNAKPIYVRYRNAQSFPAEDFLNSLKKGVKMAVVVNPNNPTGSVIREKDMLEIVKKARRQNILLLIDEAYYYFYNKSYIKLINKFGNLIVLRTFSKLCGMAGCRLGYAAAQAGIIRNLKKVKPTYDVNALSVLFADRFLKTKRLIGRLVSDSKEGKDYIISNLVKERIKYIPGHANFVLIECRRGAAALINDLRKRKILISGNFQQPFLKNFIRVTTNSKRTMSIFWKIFIRVYRKHEKR
ncbi:MAG: histidinol-phosphate transaminase [Elusimicrobiota bacterium]